VDLSLSFVAYRQQLQQKEIQRIQLNQQLRRSQRTVSKLLKQARGGGAHDEAESSMLDDTKSIFTSSPARDHSSATSGLQVLTYIAIFSPLRKHPP
jgi:hypothetical protein